jgi:hypothetical protein
MRNKIVFIIGAGHSGSTLLAKALNSHSHLFSLSEISNFFEDINSTYALCGCELLLNDCPFWDRINSRLKEINGKGIKDFPYEYAWIRSAELNSFIGKIYYRLARFIATSFNLKNSFFKNRLENIETLYSTLFEVTNKSILVDSSKSAKRAFILARYLKQYDSYFIHLIRDGRAVLYSYQKGYYKLNLKDPVTGERQWKTFYSKTGRSIDESIRVWCRDNREAMRFELMIRKNRFIRIKYEDLANSPEKTLGKLMDFLEQEYEPGMLNLRRYVNHMVSGNASRINAVEITPPSDHWIEWMTANMIQRFEKKAGKLNRKLGYQ